MICAAGKIEEIIEETIISKFVMVINSNPNKLFCLRFFKEVAAKAVFTFLAKSLSTSIRHVNDYVSGLIIQYVIGVLSFNSG
ncbi:MAG: hypothetical protein ACJAT1_000570 [Marivirga sp.]